jgi:hypothetical protein
MLLLEDDLLSREMLLMRIGDLFKQAFMAGDGNDGFHRSEQFRV